MIGIYILFIDLKYGDVFSFHFIENKKFCDGILCLSMQTR